MRNLVLPVLASLALAAPAMADTRAEVRGGVISYSGNSEATYGAAAGVDFDLAPLIFAGVEVSADKVNGTGAKTAWGVSGRLGAKLPSGTKLFAAGGYTTEVCDLCDAQWHAGAGLQQSIMGPFYVKAEYRHYFPNNLIQAGDAGVVGVGVSF